MRFHNEKGLTLIELLAAITITAFVIGLISTMIYTSNRSFTTITNRESVQEQARMLTEHIVGKVREKAYTISQDSTYFLKLTDSTTSSNYIYYQFSKPNVTILTSSGRTQTSMTIASNVESISVTLGESNHKIDLNLQFAPANTPSYKYETTIRVPSWNQN